MTQKAVRSSRTPARSCTVKVFKLIPAVTKYKPLCRLKHPEMLERKAHSRWRLSPAARALSCSCHGSAWGSSRLRRASPPDRRQSEWLQKAKFKTSGLLSNANSHTNSSLWYIPLISVTTTVTFFFCFYTIKPEITDIHSQNNLWVSSCCINQQLA